MEEQMAQSRWHRAGQVRAGVVEGGSCNDTDEKEAGR